MLDNIVNALSGVNGYLAVFIISMLPVVELRGAIPVGVGLDLNWLLLYVASVCGNMILVPFIILFIRPIVEFLMRTKKLRPLGEKIKNKVMSKSAKVTKYKMMGLFVFVAIPLPGTGAWTGAMLAGLMDMRLKDAVPMILLGVMVAGVLMMGISYGFGELFSHFFAI